MTPPNTLNGEPTTDHEFAAQLRARNWDGTTRPGRSSHTTHFMRGEDIVAVVAYDNRECKFDAWMEPL